MKPRPLCLAALAIAAAALILTAEAHTANDPVGGGIRKHVPAPAFRQAPGDGGSFDTAPRQSTDRTAGEETAGQHASQHRRNAAVWLAVIASSIHVRGN